VAAILQGQILYLEAPLLLGSADDRPSHFALPDIANSNTCPDECASLGINGLNGSFHQN
jgi:hypothetical protein